MSKLERVLLENEDCGCTTHPLDFDVEDEHGVTFEMEVLPEDRVLLNICGKENGPRFFTTNNVVKLAAIRDRLSAIINDMDRRETN